MLLTRDCLKFIYMTPIFPDCHFKRREFQNKKSIPKKHNLGNNAQFNRFLWQLSSFLLVSEGVSVCERKVATLPLITSGASHQRASLHSDAKQLCFESTFVSLYLNMLIIPPMGLKLMKPVFFIFSHFRKIESSKCSSTTQEKDQKREKYMYINILFFRGPLDKY